MKKTLDNFPNAFLPLVVVIGDRRENPPHNMADILAYSVSATDILFMYHLGLCMKSIDVISDKIFVLEDTKTLKKKFGNTNLLIIGSPAVNLLSRKINESSLFHFNISQKAKKQLAMQEEILGKLKFERTSLRIYHEILYGATSIDEIIRKVKGHKTNIQTLKASINELLKKHEQTGLSNWKDLLHEFDRPGIKDPIDNTIHGESPKPHLDYGLISIAPNPYSDSDEYSSIYVAGVHAPGTAHCLRLLSEHEAFVAHPFGGVLEIDINLNQGWSDRLYNATIDWQTSNYSEKDVQIPSNFIKIAYPSKKYKEIFFSSPYNESDKTQKNVNNFIEGLCKTFYIQKDISVIFHNPYFLRPVIPFPDDVFAKFKGCDFVIHDMTKFSKGVMFEIGVSLGLRKYFF
jgi:hypothetical protein